MCTAPPAPHTHCSWKRPPHTLCSPSLLLREGGCTRNHWAWQSEGWIHCPTHWDSWATSRGLILSFRKTGEQLPLCLPQAVVVWPRRCAICKGTPPPALPTGHVALSLQPECAVAFWHIIYLGSPSPPSLSGYINMHLG